jgi:23S rRNA maturation-related 3'-5' exoribonuclease YhaM
MNDYIEKIKDKEIKENVKKAYEALPEYFHKVAASSSGKYHPRFSLGEGGLKRHTKFAIDMAFELFKLYTFSEVEKDCIVGALILHDGLKHGLNYEKYCVNNHADIMADWLNDFWKEVIVKGVEVDVKLFIICECVRSHMGQWSVVRPPITEVEKFVHLCDYIASRKIIDNYYENQ